MKRATRAVVTRAALFFAGTSVVAACEKSTDSSTFEEPDGAVHDDGMAAAFYGVPPIDSSRPDVAESTTNDARSDNDAATSDASDAEASD